MDEIIKKMPERWKDEFLFSRSQGLSEKEAYIKLGIKRAEHLELLRDNEDYKAAVELGKDLEYAYYMRLGRWGILAGRNFNPTAYVWITKQRLGFSDKGEEKEIEEKNGKLGKGKKGSAKQEGLKAIYGGKKNAV